MRFVRCLKVDNAVFATFMWFCSFSKFCINVAAKPIIRYCYLWMSTLHSKFSYEAKHN